MCFSIKPWIGFTPPWPILLFGANPSPLNVFWRLSMGFNGSGPLVKRCDGFDGSLWSTWDKNSKSSTSQKYVFTYWVLVQVLLVPPWRSSSGMPGSGSRQLQLSVGERQAQLPGRERPASVTESNFWRYCFSSWSRQLVLLQQQQQQLVQRRSRQLYDRGLWSAASTVSSWVNSREGDTEAADVKMWKVLLELSLISTESEWPDRARLTGWFAAIGCLPRFTRTSEINYFWLLQCSNWVIKEIFCSSAPAVWVHLGVGVGSIRVGDCRRMGHPALRRIYVSALVFYHCNLIIILFFSIISTFYGHCWSLVSNWGPLAMIYADLCC